MAYIERYTKVSNRHQYYGFCCMRQLDTKIMLLLAIRQGQEYNQDLHTSLRQLLLQERIAWVMFSSPLDFDRPVQADDHGRFRRISNRQKKHPDANHS